MDALHFFVGTRWRVEDLLSTFGEKIEARGDEKLVVTGFIEFQYGDLNPDNRVHKSVLNRLEKLAPIKDLTSPLLGAKDKDKDKDQDKEKEKGSAEGKNQTRYKPDLEAIYRRYPRKKGKSPGLRKLASTIKTPSDMIEASTALDRFLDHHKREGTEAKFIPHFSTWAGAWRDCLDPTYGQADGFASSTSAADLERELEIIARGRGEL